MDIVNTIFKVVVGKSKVAWQKDKIRHLEELQAYYDKRGMDEVADNFEKIISEEYISLAKIEEKIMKRG